MLLFHYFFVSDTGFKIANCVFVKVKYQKVFFIYILLFDMNSIYYLLATLNRRHSKQFISKFKHTHRHSQYYYCRHKIEKKWKISPRFSAWSDQAKRNTIICIKIKNFLKLTISLSLWMICNFFCCCLSSQSVLYYFFYFSLLKFVGSFPFCWNINRMSSSKARNKLNSNKIFIL